MMITFSKYSGCGNDFILIDNRCGIFPHENQELIQALCHRHKGIGADGIILLEDSYECDFRMKIFNCDSSEAEMCGNGIRCLMRFIQELGLAKPQCKIETMHRHIQLALQGSLVRAHLGPPSDQKWDIQLVLP